MSESAPCFDIDAYAELTALLGQLQGAILKHPVAAQAAFAALVAEGRAFAKTPEGRAWHQRLASSPLVERGRSLWELTTLGVLEDDRSVVVPSRILDAFVKLAHENLVETVLTRLYTRDTGERDVDSP